MAAAKLLVSFFEDLLSLGTSPEAFSTIVVSHILKPGKDRKADVLSDHRPIACFSVVAKVVMNALRRFCLELTGPLQGLEQFAEQPRTCSEMAAFTISSVLQARKGKKTLVAYVDIKGAYDICWKPALWLKLHMAGLRGPAWTLLKAILSNHPTCLKVAGRVSKMYNIAVGLAQGSPLSGFCFTAFLDDLATLFKEENICLCGEWEVPAKQSSISQGVETAL